MNKRSTLKPFLALFGLGLAGVLSLVPFARRQVDTAYAAAKEPPPLPKGAAVVLALVQSAALLALAVWGGLRLVPRLGLRSHLVDAVQGRPAGAPFAWKRALAGALLAPATILGGERLFRPWTGPALAQLEAEQQPHSRGMAVMGVLYGGLTEELLMRWGLMSFLARLLQRLRGESGPAGDASVTMGSALTLAAFLFGVGHLPALAALVTLTPALVIRTILLNMSGGLIFGYLFWRESLEAAMVAHGGSHVVLALARAAARRK